MAGHDVVFHLAANTDIPSGFTKHRIDLDNDVIATCNVLEAMLKNGRQGACSSRRPARFTASRSRGRSTRPRARSFPCLSTARAKIASEAFISAYCNLFGIRAWMYRFGNVIGERTNHGVIYDFIAKLKKSPQSLEILGTGRGEKNYFLVEECINGMLFFHQQLKDGPFPVLLNLGTDSTTQVMEISKIIIEEMGLKDVAYTYTRHSPRLARRSTGGLARYEQDSRARLVRSSNLHRRGSHRHTSLARQRSLSAHGRDHVVKKRSRREEEEPAKKRRPSRKRPRRPSGARRASPAKKRDQRLKSPSPSQRADGLRRRNLASRSGQRGWFCRQGLPRHRRRPRSEEGEAAAARGTPPLFEPGLEELTREHLEERSASLLE